MATVQDGNAANLRGIIPILVTPFDAEDRIDEESLANLVEFNIQAGVHGLGVALGSEIFKLTDAERAQLLRAVVRAVRGRVPVVVNTGASGTALSILHAAAAEEAGADALMVYPPHFLPVGAEEVLDFFRKLDAAVRLPIVLQDIPQAPIPPALALRIAGHCPNVRVIKVENLPVAARVSEMVAALDGRLAVFGGAGGTYFIEELRRGAAGTMPFCSQPADFVEVWDRFHRGDESGARQRFESTIMPVNHLGMLGGDVFYHLHKRMLVRQGVLRSAAVRGPTSPIDLTTEEEFEALLDRMFPSPRPFGAWDRDRSA